MRYGMNQVKSMNEVYLGTTKIEKSSFDGRFSGLCGVIGIHEESRESFKVPAVSLLV